MSAQIAQEGRGAADIAKLRDWLLKQS